MLSLMKAKMIINTDENCKDINQNANKDTLIMVIKK